MVWGRYFITPHAVQQFQARVARLEYTECIRVIADALEAAPIERHAVTYNGTAMRVRVRKPFHFRAIIVPGDPLPVVTTILKSGKRGQNRGRMQLYAANKD